MLRKWSPRLMFAPMQRRWIAWVAAIVAGCGSSDGGAGSSSGSGSASGGSGSSAVAVAAGSSAGTGSAAAGPAARPSGVEVLDAGAAPRQRLQHRLTAGTHTVLVVEVDLDRTGPTGDGPLPTLVTTLDVRVESVTGDRAKLKTTVTKVGASSRDGAAVPTEAIAAQAALLEGAVVTSTVLPDGSISELSVKLPARDVPPDLAAAATRQLSVMEKMALRLPAAPIGVGGAWRYTVDDAPTGIPVHAQTTVTVTALTATHLTYELTTTLRGDDHRMQAAGMDLMVTKLAGSGKGKGTVDLTSWAQTSELVQSLAFDMAASGETASASMTQAIRIASPAQGAQSAP